MTVDPNDSAGSCIHEGVTYHFCSEGCLEAFQENPSEYLDEALQAEKRATRDAAASNDALFICPMHPQVKQVGPGSCPICGMALEPRVVTLEEQNPELDDMTRRFRWSVVVTVPILAFMISEFLPG